jgi:hypothetical protein
MFYTAHSFDTVQKAVRVMKRLRPKQPLKVVQQNIDHEAGHQPFNNIHRDTMNALNGGVTKRDHWVTRRL